MADTSNLRNYLTDVANSIRNVTGSNNSILANEYDLIINNFILANETSINITPMVNAQHFGPAAGYSGYNSINIAAVDNVLEPNMTPENIANGVNIFGVIGSMTAGEDLNNELNNQSNTIANLQNEVNTLSDALNNAYTGINSINLSNMNYSETAKFVHSSDGSNGAFGVVKMPISGSLYTGGHLCSDGNIAKCINTVSGVYTNNITNLSNMFNNFSNITSIPNLNTTSATNMSNMFNNCRNLPTSGLPNFDTSNVTNMSHMFDSCVTLYNNMPNYNTINVTNMAYMFNMTNLTSVPNFDTSNVTDMSTMFYFCRYLRNVPDWNTINVVNMFRMFDSCSLVLNYLPNFDTSNVSNMNGMFMSCWELKDASVASFNYNLNNVVDIGRLFSSCNKINTIANINLSTGKPSKMTSMFSGATLLKNVDNVDFSNGYDVSQMFYNLQNLKNVTNVTMTEVNNAYQMFNNCKNLINIDGLNITFDNTTPGNMYYMFSGCSNIVNAPIMNTVSVTTLSYAFYGCTNLVNVPEYDTSNIMFMTNAFAYCGKLSTDSINNIVNMCINAVNITNTQFKNLSNINNRSPLYGTKFDNSYYTDYHAALTAAGWTY